MIPLAFDQLTKRYGSVTAVDGLTAGIQPGRVTAFLGGQRLGQDDQHARPARADRAHLGHGDHRRARLPRPRPPGPGRRRGPRPGLPPQPERAPPPAHRRAAGRGAGPARRRAPAEFGLADAAGRRVGGFSLGMRQRLALATALVGDPGVLVLDEPFNGLDPEGITALRAFLRRFADDGGTVFLSSHLLGEVEHVADDSSSSTGPAGRGRARRRPAPRPGWRP